MPLPLVLVALLVLSTSAVGQTLYKSVGPDGKVVYSDRPPAAGKVDKTLRVQDLPNTAIPERSLAEIAAMQKSSKSAAAPSADVVLFSATWCGYCRQAKAFLAQRGIQYQEQDIDTPGGKLAFAQAGGGKGVPLLLASGARLQGFSLASYDSLFSRR